MAKVSDPIIIGKNVDLGRAILADPAICEAALTGAPYVKCFNCPRCQYGPGMPHKCPAAMKRA